MLIPKVIYLGFVMTYLALINPVLKNLAKTPHNQSKDSKATKHIVLLTDSIVLHLTILGFNNFV